ncbi:MAG TPA: aminotransferase class V-fold PLP-dependent enzyme, partial [Burkholderiaceae bacterium]
MLENASKSCAASTDRPVYLDYAATTPVDRRVANKMIPYLTEIFGNPASRSHAYGWAAEEAVELAR